MKRRPTRPASWLRALARFPAGVRSELDALWDRGGRLAADDVARLAKTLRVDARAFMMQLLPLAQAYAVVPVSHYPVGAIAAGMVDRSMRAPALYFGANYEIAGIALSFTVHAEQSATNHAWLQGEAGLSAIAVTAAPCGYCRQFLNELGDAATLPVLLPAANRAGYTAAPLAKLLPQAFGPADLGVRGGLMSGRKVRLQVEPAAESDEVAAAARLAAESSYAPYRTDRVGQFSGVALVAQGGQIFAGRYAGNAAYNPSLSPLESALAFMRVNTPLDRAPSVQRCALVEVPTLASQRSATAAVLAAVAPDVTLEYHPAKLRSRR